MFSIGSTVRVTLPSGHVCRSTILCDNENDTFDVLYKNNPSTPSHDERTVDISQMAPLLPFELIPLQDTSPEEAKNYGNILFEKKDYDAAYEYYSLASKSFSAQALSVGSRVLVHISESKGGSDDGSTYRFEVAMVSNVRSNGNVDVIYDNDVNGSDEEDDVDSKRILIIVPEDREGECSESHKLELQRGVYMNLARCALKRGLRGWAVRWALIAQALIRGEFERFDNNKRTKYLADVYFVLSKALLTACRPHLAKQAALELQQLEESTFNLKPSGRGRALLKEVEQFRLKRRKDNRALAKNIAEWVDVAMNTRQQVSTEDDAAMVSCATDESRSAGVSPSSAPANSQDSSSSNNSQNTESNFDCIIS